MAATEVESAIFRFMSSLGQGTDWDPEEFDSICEMIPAFKFGILVTGENIKVTFIAEPRPHSVENELFLYQSLYHC